jgi:hypothetical protein
LRFALHVLPNYDPSGLTPTHAHSQPVEDSFQINILTAHIQPEEPQQGPEPSQHKLSQCSGTGVFIFIFKAF